MALVVNDTFTDTSGTALASHTGETGATWALHSSYTGTAVISNANRVRHGTGSAASVFYASGVPASAEYDVTADVYIASLSIWGTSLLGRVDTAAHNFYRARRIDANWQLRKMVAGVSTTLGTWTNAATDEAVEAAKLEIRDAQKALFVGGTSRLTSADNAITGAGRAGIMFEAQAGSDTTLVHVDNFQCNDLAAGGGIQLSPQIMAFE